MCFTTYILHANQLSSDQWKASIGGKEVKCFKRRPHDDYRRSKDGIYCITLNQRDPA